MHAGVGSIMVSLANGKRPVVMARLTELGEHVDDHQLELARRLEAGGLVALAEDADELTVELRRGSIRPGRLEGVPWLGNDLGRYLVEVVGEPRRDLRALRAS